MDTGREALQRALGRQQQPRATTNNTGLRHHQLVARKKQPPVNYPLILEPVHIIDEKIGRIQPAVMVRVPFTPPPPPPSYHPSSSHLDLSHPPPLAINPRIHPPLQNKDGHHTQIHLHRPRDADLLEQFCRDRLPADDIYVPAQHQPVNPEDEDDVVPDQHAAFGIQRATQARREPAWRDYGLGELMGRGPEAGVWKGVGRQGPKGPSRLPR